MVDAFSSRESVGQRVYFTQQGQDRNWPGQVIGFGQFALLHQVFHDRGDAVCEDVIATAGVLEGA